MGARVLAYRDVLFTDTRQEHMGPHDGRWDLTMGARILAYRDVLFTDTRQEHQGPHDGRSCPRIQRRAVH
ncbi:hypothetical protein NDU88_000496 [Pleurodeles waltl]|uniref:Uncharacterized protein n=1 Tax=Pleurodeles waltl TaxID=8319 RepID=A0AAV7R4D0_PLEWA|nr:hypothetical protein NDU88_000480 [Pleurodeles waltl]KAJ1147622.1 hypothetical protein NDU88_000482 [Pleurodeles waltl]KAJ1147625.1 hypothetical protein NDU88_000485 [Pleurodeles waltl]KAJ1147631.1 hypothetical protein NDU88_000491 [Pleurodeles waltl]KAJ1147633.1 hypothetical protein NDU88_000493 [Pleurodeles waltl]